MYLKRLCFGEEIRLPSSGPRIYRTGEVSGIAASLNAFFYDVISFFYVRELVLASKMKIKNMEKRKNLINIKFD